MTVQDGVLTCPDCGESASGVMPAHMKWCAGARALERRSDRDRVWFTKHPGVSAYSRPMEAADLGMSDGSDIQAEDPVLVTQLSPGVRHRRLPPFIAIFEEGNEARVEYAMQLSLLGRPQA